MKEQPDLTVPAYGIVVLGLILSFITAVVPHYDTGHKLLFGTLASGCLPYVVYGASTEVLRGWDLLLPGILILLVDLLVKIPARFPVYSEYSSGLIYVTPLLLIGVVLPAGIIIARQLSKHKARHINSKGAGDKT